MRHRKVNLLETQYLRSLFARMYGLSDQATRIARVAGALHLRAHVSSSRKCITLNLHSRASEERSYARYYLLLPSIPRSRFKCKMYRIGIWSKALLDDIQSGSTRFPPVEYCVEISSNEILEIVEWCGKSWITCALVVRLHCENLNRGWLKDHISALACQNIK